MLSNCFAFQTLLTHHFHGPLLILYILSPILFRSALEWLVSARSENLVKATEYITVHTEKREE